MFERSGQGSESEILVTRISSSIIAESAVILVCPTVEAVTISTGSQCIHVEVQPHGFGFGLAVTVVCCGGHNGRFVVARIAGCALSVESAAATVGASLCSLSRLYMSAFPQAQYRFGMGWRGMSSYVDMPQVYGCAL